MSGRPGRVAWTFGVVRFFFSSRRRHTRYIGDWSSDVCSSDLGFVHGNALLRHAGLNLAEASSGKWTGQMVISKRGRSRLRRFLFMATMSLVMTNSEFKAMQDRKSVV